MHTQSNPLWFSTETVRHTPTKIMLIFARIEKGEDCALRLSEYTNNVQEEVV